MKKIIFSILLLSLLLISCGSTKVTKDEYQDNVIETPKATPRPDWVLDPKSVYDDELYLSQVGEGYTKSEALADAQLEMARFFGSKIESTVIGTENMYSNNKGTVATDKSLEKEYKISMDTTLYAVEKTKPWYDATTDTYYVCIYIDRNKAFEIIKPTFVKSRDEFYKFYNSALNETDVLNQVNLLNSAIALGETYLENLKAVLVIIPTAFKMYRDDIDDITNASFLLKKLTSNASVNLKVNNDYNNKFYDTIAKYFTDNGFKISPKDYHYNAIVNINENKTVDDFSGLIVLRPDVTITLKDKSGVKTYITYTTSIPAQKSYNEKTVTQKAIKAITAELNNSFVPELQEFADQ